MNDKEKIDAFDRIAKEFYIRNFGSLSKAGMETLMFDIYLEHLLNTGQAFDDYTMSKVLGIGQSRVRALKVRKELKFPHEGFDWKKSFIELIKNADYNKETRTIKMLITDVNVMSELRYYMECNNWYDEYSLNPRLFSCKLDFFVKLCKRLSDENFVLDEESESYLKTLESNLSDKKEKTAIRKIIEGATEEGLKSLALSASKEILLGVLKQMPFGGVAASAIDALLTVIEKS